MPGPGSLLGFLRERQGKAGDSVGTASLHNAWAPAVWYLVAQDGLVALPAFDLLDLASPGRSSFSSTNKIF